MLVRCHEVLADGEGQLGGPKLQLTLSTVCCGVCIYVLQNLCCYRIPIFVPASACSHGFWCLMFSQTCVWRCLCVRARLFFSIQCCHSTSLVLYHHFAGVFLVWSPCHLTGRAALGGSI